MGDDCITREAVGVSVCFFLPLFVSKLTQHHWGYRSWWTGVVRKLQSINQSINQSTYQPTNQPTNHSTNQSINPPKEHPHFVVPTQGTLWATILAGHFLPDQPGYWEAKTKKKQTKTNNNNNNNKQQPEMTLLTFLQHNHTELYQFGSKSSQSYSILYPGFTLLAPYCTQDYLTCAILHPGLPELRHIVPRFT